MFLDSLHINNSSFRRVRLCDTVIHEPVPPAVPGEFVIYLWADDVLDKLDPGLASLLLTWIELMGVVGFPDRLRLLGIKLFFEILRPSPG